MTDLTEKIRVLKEEKGAVIFAHNYQKPEVLDIADFVGDSLELARKGLEVPEEIIVFCGVSFMAETSKILTPGKKVFLPSLAAVCPMAEMVGVETVRELREAHPGVPVVAYVNTRADVKAEADICCTSANAVSIVEGLPGNEVIMVPDANLAQYVASETGKKVWWPDGYCYVHSKILPSAVEAAKAEHSGAEVLLHPECPPETLALADHVFSTSGMLRHAQESDCEEFIIGTEEGMIEVLSRGAPEKKFYPVGGVCIQQKKINLERVHECLKDEKNEVIIDPAVAEKARDSINKML